MKALAVQQPWASLLCLGIKDVENRSWSTKHRGKLLIVASQKKVTRNFMGGLPDETYWELENQIKLDNITQDLQSLPTSAVIGYVEVVDCVEEYESPWADPGSIKWIIKNAHIFAEPQLVGIKAKLNIFDIPEIDENNLPESIEADPDMPSIENGCFYLPTTDESIEYFANEINANKNITLDIERSWSFDQAFKKDGNDIELCSINKLCFIGETVFMETTISKLSIENNYDDNGNQIFNTFTLSGDTTPLQSYSFEISGIINIQEYSQNE